MAKRTDPELVRRAATHPDRPGEQCHATPGTWRPVVALGRCEGKGACEAVCPYDVFSVERIHDEDFAALGFFARLKVRAHGMKSAYTPNASACRACGLCVVACPEGAISLVAVGA